MSAHEKLVLSPDDLARSKEYAAQLIELVEVWKDRQKFHERIDEIAAAEPPRIVEAVHQLVRDHLTGGIKKLSQQLLDEKLKRWEARNRGK